MRRGKCCVWALLEILLGCIILLALVLPATVWWFLLGAGLVGGGLWLLRC